jgi:hypothetical protein
MKSKPELGLNAEEFGAAFQQVWPELSGAEMESVFSKVDATADGLPTPTPTLTPTPTPTKVDATADGLPTPTPTLTPPPTPTKVDATADGLVAWDEFLSFMVLHNQACQ